MIDWSIFTPQVTLVIIGLVLIGLELLVGIETGFDLVLVGASLIIGGLVGIATNSPIIAIAVATLLSFSYIALGRNLVKSKIIHTSKATNSDKLIDQTGIVTATILPNKSGMVKIDDEIWRANADQKIEKSESVIVQSIEGITLNVEKKPKKE